MKILIATPCSYGLATTAYVQSLLGVIAHLGNDRHEVVVKMQGTESLINRARNSDATYALTQGFDKILFIDADMVFDYADVLRLIKSDKKIIGGTYPLKNFPITLNFNPLPQHRDLFGKDRQQDNYIAWVEKYADERGEAEVEHVPTGFLLIDCSVLAELTYKVPWYQNFNPDVKTTTTYYEFFPTSVVDNQLFSEDFGFCNTARAHGHKIYLQTRSVTGHSGGWVFRLGQHEIVSGQKPLIGT